METDHICVNTDVLALHQGSLLITDKFIVVMHNLQMVIIHGDFADITFQEAKEQVYKAHYAMQKKE